MAGIQDFWEFKDDFIGGGIFGSSATAFDPWVFSITGTTPTVTRIDLGQTTGVFRPGVAQLVFAGSTEAQNASLHFGDKLAFDINNLRGVEIGCRIVATTGSAKDTTTRMAWGVSGDLDVDIDTIANAALFHLDTATGVSTVTVETDDGTNDTESVSTFNMTDLSWYKFYIDFSKLTDIKFYAGLHTKNSTMQRLGAGTTFDMSNYSAGLQPFMHIQKSSDSNTDALQVDYFRAWGVRVAS